ncbi:MAG: nucleotidyltransferase family protein [Bacillota bacterium]
MVSAIILAAGQSSRMGTPKQLLRIEGRAFIRIVAENALASSADEVVVVTGHRAREVTAAIDGLPVKTVFNPRYREGQGASLALGVKEISVNSSAFLVLMADQPLISPALIDTVIGRFNRSRCLALRPVCRGLPGHPVIFSPSLRAELAALEGDRGARGVLEKLGDRVCYLPVQDGAAVFDVDTPEDFERLKKARINNDIVE